MNKQLLCCMINPIAKCDDCGVKYCEVCFNDKDLWKREEFKWDREAPYHYAGAGCKKAIVLIGGI